MPREIEWVPWAAGDKPAARRRGPHVFSGKIVKWAFCLRCGLICLRNAASRQAEKKQCEWEE